MNLKHLGFSTGILLLGTAVSQSQTATQTNAVLSAVAPMVTNDWQAEIITNEVRTPNLPGPYQLQQPASFGAASPIHGDAPLLQPAPATPEVGYSRGVPLAGTSQLGGGPPALPGANLPPIFRWGKLSFRPRLAYSATYGNSLSYAPGSQAGSWIHQFSPAVTFNLGDHWSLDYTPTMRWYSDERLSDGVDHSVALMGQTTYKEWRLGLSQGFGISSQPLMETAAETSQETWSTTLGAGRALTDKLSVDLSLSQSLRFTDGATDQASVGDFPGAYTDVREWGTMNWLDYQYIDPLSFGVGLGFKYDDVETGSDMTSEQVQGRVQWRPGVKLTLSLSAGVDIRQYIDSDQSGMVSPIFTLSANYRLFETTSLFASANRGVAPSYFSNEVNESTGLSAGVSQRLLKRLFLTVSGGYSTTSYSGTGGDGVPSRQGMGDNASTSFSASLATSFLKGRGSVSLFYTKAFNDSDSEIYNYDPQTVGAQVAYTF